MSVSFTRIGNLIPSIKGHGQCYGCKASMPPELNAYYCKTCQETANVKKSSQLARNADKTQYKALKDRQARLKCIQVAAWRRDDPIGYYNSLPDL